MPSPGRDSERVEDGQRWLAHPRLARLIRGVVLLGPVLIAATLTWVVQRLLPVPASRLDWLGRGGALLVFSLLVLLAIDRAAQRLVPLATLLELTLLFPDRAPSRAAMAHRAATRRPLPEQLRQASAAGDPAEAAEQILGLVAALSRHDWVTRGHSERVRLLTDVVTDQLGLPSRDRDLLRWAALLHDVGKLRVPAEVLNKPGTLDPAEWVVLKQHPSAGKEIAGALLPWLGPWGSVIDQHHERYDGTGYPNGLAGEQIHLGARIVAVTDAFDVMTAARSYRKPMSRAAAYRELTRCSGSHFDPVVVRAMLAVSAPRLSRTQGLLAWLADAAILGRQAVSAAGVAKTVGGAALVLGTGGLLLPLPHPRPPVASQITPGPLGTGSSHAGGGTLAPSGTATGWAGNPTGNPTGSAPTGNRAGRPPTARTPATTPQPSLSPSPTPPGSSVLTPLTAQLSGVASALGSAVSSVVSDVGPALSGSPSRAGQGGPASLP